MAPMKALVRERIKDWRGRLVEKLGKRVVELTGLPFLIFVYCLYWYTKITLYLRPIKDCLQNDLDEIMLPNYLRILVFLVIYDEGAWSRSSVNSSSSSPVCFVLISYIHLVIQSVIPL